MVPSRSRACFCPAWEWLPLSSWQTTSAWNGGQKPRRGHDRDSSGPIFTLYSFHQGVQFNSLWSARAQAEGEAVPHLFPGAPWTPIADSRPQLRTIFCLRTSDATANAPTETHMSCRQEYRARLTFTG